MTDTPSSPSGRKPRKPTKYQVELAARRQLAKERAERERQEAARRADPAKKYWPRFAEFPANETLQEFLSRWTPDRMMEEWRRQISAFGIDPSQVVQTYDFCALRTSSRIRQAL